MLRLTLSEKQKKSLQFLSGLPAESLSAAAEALRRKTPPALRLTELREVLSAHLAPDDARTLAQQLLGLESMRRQSGSSPSEVIDALTAALADVWSSDDIGNWEEKRVFLLGLLETNSVCATAKVLDLSFDQDNLLYASRIITDIRPVFTEDRAEVIGGVVLISLKIEYQSGDANNIITFALDERDVKNLKIHCENALKKAKYARDLFKEKVGVDALVSGEETHGSSR